MKEKDETDLGRRREWGTTNKETKMRAKGRPKGGERIPENKQERGRKGEEDEGNKRRQSKRREE